MTVWLHGLRLLWRNGLQAGAVLVELTPLDK